MGYWNTTDNAVLDALSPAARAAYETLQQNQQELVGTSAGNTGHFVKLH